MEGKTGVYESAGLASEMMQEETLVFPNRITDNISVMVTISAIIWLLIAIYQILIGLVFLIFGVGIATIACGVWNIYACIKNFKHARYVKNCSSAFEGRQIVYSYQDSLGNTILFLVINLVLGGGLGVVGAIFDLILRSYVLSHKKELGV